ncbi:hypothetical protein PGT21_028760 [Puccinia graminis f. sp. tritici]|uniref:Uncharacterized protein n=1 Tax=Puccinia graminis f. sp. tritici TaxID=56615 RepID=A0A5B0MYL0_PUCGR|nr:hypothetical protein PGT21_028760 [Puccinia graminis f. sp. tritici]KAA1131231.1 hypothetical protein PGTUg99_026026 [Puccinia graminis f. sp. tritici]
MLSLIDLLQKLVERHIDCVCGGFSCCNTYLIVCSSRDLVLDRIYQILGYANRSWIYRNTNRPAMGAQAETVDPISPKFNISPSLLWVPNETVKCHIDGPIGGSLKQQQKN